MKIIFKPTYKFFYHFFPCYLHSLSCLVGSEPRGVNCNCITSIVGVINSIATILCVVFYKFLCLTYSLILLNYDYFYFVATIKFLYCITSYINAMQYVLFSVSVSCDRAFYSICHHLLFLPPSTIFMSNSQF